MEEEKLLTKLDPVLQKKLDALCQKRDKFFSEWEYYLKASQSGKLKLEDKLNQFQLSEDLHDAFTHLDSLIRKLKNALSGFDPVSNGANRLEKMEEYVMKHSWILARPRPRNSLIKFFESFSTNESNANKTMHLVNNFLEEIKKIIKLANTTKIPAPIDSVEASAMLEIRVTDFHGRNL